MDIKEKLSIIIHERMKTKSELDALRFIIENDKYCYDSIINILLDKLNNLNKIENELYEELRRKN